MNVSAPGFASTMDLNADVGESFGQWTLGDDTAIMEQITSASIACGFHAGDPTTMRQACATAAAQAFRRPQSAVLPLGAVALHAH